MAVGEDVVADNAVAGAADLHDAIYAARPTGGITPGIEIAHAGTGAHVVLDDDVIDKRCSRVNLDRGVVGEIDAAIADGAIAATDANPRSGAILNRQAIQYDASSLMLTMLLSPSGK